MGNVALFQARLRAKVFGGAHLSSIASQREVIHPEEIFVSQEAISLPGEFERVHASISTAGLEQQLDWLGSGSARHIATVAYLVTDARIGDGSVFKGAYVDKIAAAPANSSRRQTDIDEAALVSSSVIHRYFGHWIFDGLALERLAAERQLAMVGVPRTPWIHEADYRHLLGMAAPFAADRMRIGRLWITDDRGLNAGRVRRHRAVSAAMRSGFANGARTRVFLTRGSQGAARDLVNEREVVDALRQRGFVCVEPEASSGLELAAILSRAEIVAGVEGSALSHTNLTSPPGCVILNIQPPERFNAMAKKNADALEQRFAYTVADRHGAGRFHQPISPLLKTIDLIEKLL